MKNYEDLLGGIVRNETGHIVAATAIQNYWFLLVNFSAVDLNKIGNVAGTTIWVSKLYYIVVKSVNWLLAIRHQDYLREP